MKGLLDWLTVYVFIPLSPSSSGIDGQHLFLVLLSKGSLHFRASAIAMGVPGFAAWLRRKYPAMVGQRCPEDVQGLYIDLNSLIHPCCHSDVDPLVAARPECEKIRHICLAVETLVATTRPQHLVYIAIDGVAPRAKMNQQRGRRYMKSAVPEAFDSSGIVDLEKEFTREERPKAAMDLEGVRLALQSNALYGDAAAFMAEEAPEAVTRVECVGDDDFASSELECSALESRDGPRGAVAVNTEPAFDSNCISPGTAFMLQVSDTMREYVEDKLSAPDPLWKKLTVILSDAQTPGEGEHKFIDFLRSQATYAGFSGSGAHVIVSPDADLLFLSLSLHIPRVFILRNGKGVSSYVKTPVDAGRHRHRHRGTNATTDPPGAEPCLSSPLLADFFMSGKAEKSTDRTVTPRMGLPLEQEQCLSSSLLSLSPETPLDAPALCNAYEYFNMDIMGAAIVSEMYQISLAKGFTMRAEGGCELIAANGYCFDRVGGKPGGVLRREAVKTGAKRRHKGRGGGNHNAPSFHPCLASCNSKIIDDFVVLAILMGNDFLPRLPSAFCGESAMDNMVEAYIGEVLPYGYLTLGNHEINLKQLKRLFGAYSKVEAALTRDFCIKKKMFSVATVVASPLGGAVDERWRQSYFASTTVTASCVEDACRRYIEGVRFVWRYYSSTLDQVSWSWFYPYHHAPPALDVACFLERQGDALQETLPSPVQENTPPDILSQLLCILPPTSRELLPKPFWPYMKDPPADLMETFPREWLVDFTGAFEKEYLAVVLLPFANMDWLQDLVRDVAPQLSSAEERQQRACTAHLVIQREGQKLFLFGLDREEDAGPGKKAGATEQGVAHHVDPHSLDDRDSAAAQKKPCCFRLHALTAEELSANSAHQLLRSRSPRSELRYFWLSGITPQHYRPRTYSHNIPIPHLTALPENQSFRARRKAAKSSRGPLLASAESKQAESGDYNDIAQGMPSVSRVHVGGPLFAEFLICVAVVAVVTVCFVSNDIGTLRRLLGLCAAVLLAAYMLGLAVPGANSGAGVRRNNTYMTWVNWQCAHCLMMNFSKNNRCFGCEAPYDPHRSWALYTGKVAPEPPHMDPDHTPYLRKFSLSLL